METSLSIEGMYSKNCSNGGNIPKIRNKIGDTCYHCCYSTLHRKTCCIEKRNQKFKGRKGRNAV